MTKKTQLTAERQEPVAPGDDRSTLQSDTERLLATITEMVEPLGQAMPSSSEVVLHDLSRLPDSIIAVHGNVTGRRVGDPATDLLLQRATAGNLDHMLGYRTTLPDGRNMRSTTIIIRDREGTPVAALCINSDLSVWQSLNRIAGGMLGDDEELAKPADDAPDAPTEVFARDVDELAAHLIHTSILEQGIPVELMKKEHKLAIVRDLQGRGIFLLRDAVEMLATSLQVTRFTIYNYLNELADDSSAPARTPEKRKARET
ncbi:helix-turn-helix transcriptional regulator [Pseudactinotalea suaedae]|uniref:helix-turn-helix transcriptional regulator n=1 Tax=Pseudactinotalea suaedae TaxID=1524924 RepID=UPI0019D5F93C|nr:PAS domain-containing protein [Pseudactinotalea suaedae]